MWSTKEKISFAISMLIIGFGLGCFTMIHFTEKMADGQIAALEKAKAENERASGKWAVLANDELAALKACRADRDEIATVIYDVDGKSDAAPGITVGAGLLRVSLNNFIAGPGAGKPRWVFFGKADPVVIGSPAGTQYFHVNLRTGERSAPQTAQASFTSVP